MKVRLWEESDDSTLVSYDDITRVRVFTDCVLIYFKVDNHEKMEAIRMNGRHLVVED